MKILSKIYERKIIYCKCMLLSACLVFSAPSKQILIDAPINNFILPVFGANGQKLWEAAGQSAIIGRTDIFEIKKPCINCFCAMKGSRKISMSALSDHAYVDINSRSAFGYDPVEIHGQNFVALANTWEFFGNSEKIVANGKVKIFIDGDIAEFLK